MKVALYLRKSTDEQADSLDTQRTNAKRWAAGRGATVVNEFADSGISRAEFAREKRPGVYQALAAAQRREFDAIVIRDLSRLGGDLFRTGSIVNDLQATGVRLFTYADGAEVTAENAMQCLMLAFHLFGAQDEREKIASRTREAMFTLARALRVAGGVRYGYRNREVLGSDGKRAYVELEIDPGEAAVVQEVFERYASGEGLRTIAKSLNDRAIPSPRAGRPRKGSARNQASGAWRQGGIRELLRRDLYQGVWTYGGSKKTYRGGTKVRTAAPPQDVVRLDAPHLRIVRAELWSAVQAKFKRLGAPDVRKGGRPAMNLLSHTLKCGECGAPMTVYNTRKSYTTVRAYVCRAYKHGERSYEAWDPKTKKMVPGAACTNSLRRPVEEVNSTVIDWVEQHVLNEKLVLAVLKETRGRLDASLKRNTADVPQLERKVHTLQSRADKLVDECTLAPESLKPRFYARLTETEAELHEVKTQLDAKRTAPQAIELELRRLEQEAKSRLRNLKAALEGDPEKARLVMQAIFPLGISAHPTEVKNTSGKGRKVAKRYFLDGEAVAVGPLMLEPMRVDEGASGKGRPTVASPAGFEPA